MSRTGPLTKTMLNRRQVSQGDGRGRCGLHDADDHPGLRAGTGRRGGTERAHRARGHRPGPARRVRPEVDAPRERRAIRRHLRRPESPPRGHQADRRPPLRQLRLQDVSRDEGVPRDPRRHRCGADRHRRPLALAGDHHGDAGGQGCLLREAVVHDDRGGPGGGGDGASLRPDLPDGRPAAQRGAVRDGHRDGPRRPAGTGAYRPRPYRPLGRRRDEPRLAPRGAPALQGGSGLGRLARPVPLAPV